MRTRRILPALALALSIGACDEATSPGLASESQREDRLAFEPAITGTVTYDFTGLPRVLDPSCVAQNPFTAGGALANGFEGLTFLTTPPFGYCPIQDTWGLFPNQDSNELLIQLPAAATSASLEYYGTGPNPWLQLNAYADGAAVSQTYTPGVGYDVASVQGASFNQIGIASSAYDGYYYFKLTVTYAGPRVPTSKADCRGLGWQAFEFRNQGQCIRFVETGKDSR